jgi:hypothetical protein
LAEAAGGAEVFLASGVSGAGTAEVLRRALAAIRAARLAAADDAAPAGDWAAIAAGDDAREGVAGDEPE